MPPKDIQEKLLWLVNDPEVWPTLEIYLNWRIEELRRLNDNATGDSLYKNQGAIKELKDLLGFRVRLQKEHNKG